MGPLGSQYLELQIRFISLYNQVKPALNQRRRSNGPQMRYTTCMCHALIYESNLRQIELVDYCDGHKMQTCDYFMQQCHCTKHMLFFLHRHLQTEVQDVDNPLEKKYDQ